MTAVVVVLINEHTYFQYELKGRIADRGSYVYTSNRLQSSLIEIPISINSHNYWFVKKQASLFFTCRFQK